MSAVRLSELLRLPASDRAELAITLWESLSGAEREAELDVDPAQIEELERRWAAHIADPGTAVSWDEVRRKLRG